MLLGGLLLLGGCKTSQKFSSPYSGSPRPAIQNLEDLEQLSNDRALNGPLFWGRTDVTLEDGIAEKKNRFSATLIHGEPDRMRVRGTHFLLGTLFEIILDQEKAYIYLTDERTLYEGTRSDLEKIGGIFGTLSPDELIGSVRIYNEMKKGFAENRPFRLNDTKDYLYLIESSANRTVLRKVRKVDGLVKEIVVTDPNRNHAILLQVIYSKYEIYGEESKPLPSDFRIVIPDQKLEVRLELKEVKLDPPLNPEVIRTLPTRIDTIYPLESIIYQEPILPEDDQS